MQNESFQHPTGYLEDWGSCQVDGWGAGGELVGENGEEGLR